MAQLRLGYQEIQKRGAEILQVTHNTPEEARLYFRRYELKFPYLCDPELVVYRLYGVPVLRRGFVEGLQRAAVSIAAEATDLLLRGEKTPLPTPHIKRYQSMEAEQAVFIVDADGVIRFVYTAGPIGAIPSNADLLRRLATLE